MLLVQHPPHGERQVAGHERFHQKCLDAEGAGLFHRHGITKASAQDDGDIGPELTDLPRQRFTSQVWHGLVSNHQPLAFQVEQVFLIHHQTGILLLHAAAEATTTRDPDLISGMLTAIQDFVQDSFRLTADQGPETFQIGELAVWVEQGPLAVLAAVVRGNPPQTVLYCDDQLNDGAEQRFTILKERLQTTVLHFLFNTVQLAPTQAEKFVQLVVDIQALYEVAQVLDKCLCITVVGHTDREGAETVNRCSVSAALSVFARCSANMVWPRHRCRRLVSGQKPRYGWGEPQRIRHLTGAFLSGSW